LTAFILEVSDGKSASGIFTTTANEPVRQVYDRMPAIVLHDQFGRLLDPAEHAPANLLPLLVRYPAERMIAVAVSSRVNSAKPDGPECVQPAA
jgi:putative SOS response-associated peptidase YedK